MEGKGDYSGLRNMKRELLDHIDSDSETKRHKKKYHMAVGLGIAAILLTTAAFVYLMITMPSNPSAVYVVGCAAATLLMMVVIIVVNIYLRRLQAAFFARASHAAEEYANELVRTMKSGKE